MKYQTPWSLELDRPTTLLWQRFGKRGYREATTMLPGKRYFHHQGKSSFGALLSICTASSGMRAFHHYVHIRPILTRFKLSREVRRESAMPANSGLNQADPYRASNYMAIAGCKVSSEESTSSSTDIITQHNSLA